MPPRIWPPMDTYSEEARNSIQPMQVSETATNKFVYDPGFNAAKKILHSMPIDYSSVHDSDTSGMIVPAEGIPAKIQEYQIGFYMHSDFPEKERDGIEDPSVIHLNNKVTLSPVGLNPPLETKNFKQQDVITSEDAKVSIRPPLEPVANAPLPQAPADSKPRKKCTCSLM